MKESDLEILNTVQQVLRGMLIALAAGNKADLGNISSALEAFAANGEISPMAQKMLLDLASGAAGLHAAGIRKQ